MNCNVIRDLLPQYVDGLVSEETGSLVEDHLANCPACRAVADRMSASMETQEEDSTKNYIRAIRKQKRKTHIRTALIAAVTAAVVFLGWWIYMERHFQSYEIKISSTDKEIILKEVPSLALTENEKQLAEEIFRQEVVQSNLGQDEVIALPAESIQDLLFGVVPQDTEKCSVSVWRNTLWIDYVWQQNRVILEYIDHHEFHIFPLT